MVQVEFLSLSDLQKKMKETRSQTNPQSQAPSSCMPSAGGLAPNPNVRLRLAQRKDDESQIATLLDLQDPEQGVPRALEGFERYDPQAWEELEAFKPLQQSVGDAAERCTDQPREWMAMLSTAAKLAESALALRARLSGERLAGKDSSDGSTKDVREDISDSEHERQRRRQMTKAEADEAIRNLFSVGQELDRVSLQRYSYRRDATDKAVKTIRKLVVNTTDGQAAEKQYLGAWDHALNAQLATVGVHQGLLDFKLDSIQGYNVASSHGVDDCQSYLSGAQQEELDQMRNKRRDAMRRNVLYASQDRDTAKHWTSLLTDYDTIGIPTYPASMNFGDFLHASAKGRGHMKGTSFAAAVAAKKAQMEENNDGRLEAFDGKGGTLRGSGVSTAFTTVKRAFQGNNAQTQGEGQRYEPVLACDTWPSSFASITRQRLRYTDRLNLLTNEEEAGGDVDFPQCIQVRPSITNNDETNQSLIVKDFAEKVLTAVPAANKDVQLAFRSLLEECSRSGSLSAEQWGVLLDAGRETYLMASLMDDLPLHLSKIMQSWDEWRQSGNKRAEADSTALTADGDEEQKALGKAWSAAALRRSNYQFDRATKDLRQAILTAGTDGGEWCLSKEEEAGYRSQIANFAKAQKQAQRKVKQATDKVRTISEKLGVDVPATVEDLEDQLVVLRDRAKSESLRKATELAQSVQSVQPNQACSPAAAPWDSVGMSGSSESDNTDASSASSQTLVEEETGMEAPEEHRVEKPAAVRIPRSIIPYSLRNLIGDQSDSAVRPSSSDGNLRHLYTSWTEEDDEREQDARWGTIFSRLPESEQQEATAVTVTGNENANGDTSKYEEEVKRLSREWPRSDSVRVNRPWDDTVVL